MGHSRLRPAMAALGLLICLSSSGLTTAAPQPSSNPSISRHDLFVQIDPERHALLAVDRLTVDATPGRPLRLSLAGTLHLDRLVLSHSTTDDIGRDLPFQIEREATAPFGQYITVPAALVTAGAMTFTAHYHGVIDDPPKEPRHLRFVTPSETAGHIGAEGVYLSSETQWYLDFPESLSRYRLRVALPSGWTAVTQGQRRSSAPCPAELCREAGLMLAEWETAEASEALTLVANRFVETTREWSSSGGQPVRLATYLFPEDAGLADEYLDATARYLDAYMALLGPYPFESFAVVENFFASGLGMPSFTLLGSGVIKRHYVQPYALGHEIVHSWIGNSVFNRVDRGNWVEGLTTYLANYYWHEWSGDHEQARDQRHLMLRGYNLHVTPERDYPLGQFTRKQDERDNAIGYQKAAMVFHLLRQEVGDESFWRSLKALVAQYRGRHADWHDVERIFAETAAKDLRWFFAQWVERTGAPALTLKHVTAHPLAGDADGRFTLTGSVAQTGPLFQSPLPLVVGMSNSRQHLVSTRLSGADTPIKSDVPHKPLTIELDPEAMVLRRLARRDLPPVLNHYVTDAKRSVILAPAGSDTASHPFQDLVKRIRSQDDQKAPAQRTAITTLAENALLPGEGSVLVLGSPASRLTLQSLVSSHCGTRLQLRDGGVTVVGKTYDGPGIALVASCHREDRPGSVVTTVYALTPQSAAPVARLLFFYGWNSYVVFQDGKAIARGEWDAQQRQEVSLDETQSAH
ncbi:MAG TPA: M1 family aminopeptidase [Nitrospira sp.]|nr:M1 family aminopeptidase [Nitrospira sp.]